MARLASRVFQRPPRSPAVQPCGPALARALLPSRLHSDQRVRYRRHSVAPDCVVSPRLPTCAGSSPAPEVFLPMLPVARRWRDRRRDRPASFAIRSAVAGATTIKSVSRARRICPTSNSLAGSKRSVNTRSPTSALAESGVTKCSAALVMMQRTAILRSFSRRMRSSDL